MAVDKLVDSTQLDADLTSVANAIRTKGGTSAQMAFPADAVSLWVRVDDPSVEFPEWIQPTGSTDAYPMGAKVSYAGKHWISTVDSNVWTPGTFGWDEV